MSVMYYAPQHENKIRKGINLAEPSRLNEIGARAHVNQAIACLDQYIKIRLGITNPAEMTSYYRD